MDSLTLTKENRVRILEEEEVWTVELSYCLTSVLMKPKVGSQIECNIWILRLNKLWLSKATLDLSVQSSK